MLTSLKLFIIAAFLFPALSAREDTKYFKADNLTGADYFALASDGSYTLTDREHVGIWVTESGRWSKSGIRIVFTPDKSGQSPYRGLETVYRGHTFLVWEDDGNPTVVVSIEDIKRSLEDSPKSLPTYVFFQIKPKIYEQEIKQTYPFRTHPNLQ
jgi:hypothetical protein